MPRKTFIPVVVALAVALLTVAAGGVGAQDSERLAPEDISYVFAIPKSDLVFEGLLSLRSGQPCAFEAREGSMILIDPTPGDPYGRIGITLTLDREKLREDRQLGFRVGVSSIEPHKEGGESDTYLYMVSGRYNQAVELQELAIPVTIKVKKHHFEDFKDGLLITMLWEATKRDKDALRGFYDELYTLYGPTAQECIVCPDGAQRCGTSVSCGPNWL